MLCDSKFLKSRSKQKWLFSWWNSRVARTSIITRSEKSIYVSRGVIELNLFFHSSSKFSQWWTIFSHCHCLQTQHNFSNRYSFCMIHYSGTWGIFQSEPEKLNFILNTHTSSKHTSFACTSFIFNCVQMKISTTCGGVCSMFMRTYNKFAFDFYVISAVIYNSNWNGKLMSCYSSQSLWDWTISLILEHLIQ